MIKKNKLLNKNTILVTGVCGFIGYHICKKLINNKFHIVGVDTINNYYDIKFKKERLTTLKKHKNFIFYKVNISNKVKIKNIFNKHKFDYVINLAAQAGVRYSFKDPDSYFNNNIHGFYNILKLCTQFKVKHLIYASSSSVYGSQKKYPVSENFNTDSPESFYAATKKINEVMAHSFSHVYNLPTTGLRFFTVFGPDGRPDMSLYKFTEAIYYNKKVNLFNNGHHQRDFTYIDDLVEMVFPIIFKPSKKFPPYQIFNIASGKSKKLSIFLNYIETALGKKAKIKKLPFQKGDVIKTHANINNIKKISGFIYKDKFYNNIKSFVEWFKYRQK